MLLNCCNLILTIILYLKKNVKLSNFRYYDIVLSKHCTAARSLRAAGTSMADCSFALVTARDALYVKL